MQLFYQPRRYDRTNTERNQNPRAMYKRNAVRSPNFLRKRLESVLLPIMPEKQVPNVCQGRQWHRFGNPFNEPRQPKLPRDDVLDQMETILVRQARQEMEENRVLVFFDRMDMDQNEHRVERNKVYDLGLRFDLLRSARVIRHALEGTRFELLKPLILRYTEIATVAEVNFANLQMAFKRLVRHVPLAVVVDAQTCLSRADVEAMARRTPNGIDSLYAESAAAFAMPAARLHQSIGQPLQQLSTNLQSISNNSDSS